ncbi:MAG TPA: DUF1236 domain-containing protein [Xanthobacteraceae bacterium]|nr:DUF1236 domain-containing protein [Xanthobacteraceae bacterium]
MAQTVGVAVEVPDEVVTYVERESVPSVQVEEEVVVGHALPSTVELRTIPSSEKYRYAVVNKKRVIVDPGTRRIVKIIE